MVVMCFGMVCMSRCILVIVVSLRYAPSLVPGNLRIATVPTVVYAAPVSLVASIGLVRPESWLLANHGFEGSFFLTPFGKN